VQIWTHGLGGPELVESIPVAELVVEATHDGAAGTVPFRAPSDGLIQGVQAG
jgi:hypothetical protein